MSNGDTKSNSNSIAPRKFDPTQHYKDQKIAEQYDQERFSSFAGRIFNAMDRRAILGAFQDLPPDSTIVDAPCGTGRLSEVLLDAGFKVKGIDISPAMIEVANRRLGGFGQNFTAHVGDARDLSKKDIFGDAALCARALMHFPLSEQIKILKGVAGTTTGRIVISHSLNTPYQRFRRRVKKLLRHQAPVMFPVTNIELRHLFREAGLEEVKRIRPMPILMEYVVVVARHV